MDYNILGKTNLTVSAIGLGTGGPSRVGLRTGGDERAAARLIDEAIDNGANFIDTAEAYETEHVVRRALETGRHRRRELVISTKISHWEDLTANAVGAAVDRRLQELGTDYIDICHFHAVPADRYPWLVEELYPELATQRDKGKVRFLGITEAFHPDPGHKTLSLAVADDLWDVIMVGYNLLNQSAEKRVLEAALAKNIGVLVMFAVRLALSRPTRLREVVSELMSDGLLPESEIREAGGAVDQPLDWFVQESGASDLVDAAYRFVRHHAAVHVTLSGTGNKEHLAANIESVQKPPLDPKAVEKLRHLLRKVDTISGQ
ncbi:MAG: aldo/keto reductase [Spirochaetales bacterium]